MKKRQNLALPTFTQNTYAGEFAGEYIAAALLSAKTLDNKLVTIKPNVKYKSVIQKLDVSGIVQDASCDFVTSGSVALSERILEPKELQVNLELCKQEFVDSWESLQLGFSAFDTIPASFNDYLISYVAGQVAQATEQSIWQGTATNGSFLGFQTAFSASIAAGGSGAVLAAKTGSTIDSGSITTANVLNKLNNVVDTIPSAVYGKEDLLIYVGTQVAKAYQQALAGGALINARFQLAGAGTQNAGLAFGGTPFTCSCTEEYNGSSWTAGGALITARNSLAGAGTQTAGLAFGGNSPSTVSCTEEYTKASIIAICTL